MTWLQLTIETNAEYAQEVAEFLELFGANSVSFNAIDNEKIFDKFQDEKQQLWQNTAVTGLLPSDIDLDILLVCLRDRVGKENLYSNNVTLLADQDWVDHYKKSQSILWFSEKLCICPSWLEPPETEIKPLILDPGLAFGTGTHPTTALCLEWLVANDIQQKSLIDYGCGSGILALASARLGAKPVYAIDIDPQAIQASEENARINHLQQEIRFALPDQIELPVSNIIVANVLLNPLKELSLLFSSLISPGGELVLSGVLSTQVEECSAAYEPWFKMNPPIFKQEWALLHGERKQ